LRAKLASVLAAVRFDRLREQRILRDLPLRRTLRQLFERAGRQVETGHLGFLVREGGGTATATLGFGQLSLRHNVVFFLATVGRGFVVELNAFIVAHSRKEATRNLALLGAICPHEGVSTSIAVRHIRSSIVSDCLSMNGIYTDGVADRYSKEDGHDHAAND